MMPLSFLLAADISRYPGSISEGLSAGTDQGYVTSESGLKPNKTDEAALVVSPAPGTEETDIRQALKDYSETYFTGSPQKEDCLIRFFTEVENMSEPLARQYFDDMTAGGGMLKEFLDTLKAAMDRRPSDSYIGLDEYGEGYMKYLYDLLPDLVKGDLQMTYDSETDVRPVSSIAGVSQRLETVVTMFASEFNRYKAEVKLIVTNDSPSDIFLRDIYVSDALGSGVYLLSGNDLNRRLTFNGRPVDAAYIRDNGFSWPNGSGQFTQWSILENVQTLSAPGGGNAVISYTFWFTADLDDPEGVKEAVLFDACNSAFTAEFVNKNDENHIVGLSGGQLPGEFDIPPDPSEWAAYPQRFVFIADSPIRSLRGFTSNQISIAVKGGDSFYNLPADWLIGGYEFTIDGVDFTGNTAIERNDDYIEMIFNWNRLPGRSAITETGDYEYRAELKLFRPEGSPDIYTFPLRFLESSVTVNVRGMPDIFDKDVKTFDILLNLGNRAGSLACHLSVQLTEDAPLASRIIPLGRESLSDVISCEAALPMNFKINVNVPSQDFQEADRLLPAANLPVKADAEAFGNINDILAKLPTASALHPDDMDVVMEALYNGLSKEVFLEIGASDAGLWQKTESVSEKENVTITLPPVSTPEPTSAPTPIPDLTVSPTGAVRPSRRPVSDMPAYPAAGSDVMIDHHEWIVIKYVIKNGISWALLLKKECLPDESAIVDAGPPEYYEGSSVQNDLARWYANEPMPMIKSYAASADNLDADPHNQFSAPKNSAEGAVKDVMFAPSQRELYDNTELAAVIQGIIAETPNDGGYVFRTRTWESGSGNAPADTTSAGGLTAMETRRLHPAVWADADIFLAARTRITNDHQ
jgi:hypothetical protein